MVRKSFGRSLSFPIPNSSIPTAHKIKGRGSNSLPCRFHPFISRLQDEIHDLVIWHSQSQARLDPPAWICDGLARLQSLHSSLDDLLQHPQSQGPLRNRSAWTARALDDFLRFADAYGLFRSAIVALKDRQSATQAAIRRNDEFRISSCARLQRKAGKELLRIAAAVRGVSRRSPVAVREDDLAEAELAGVMREVASATAMASSAVIAGMAELSAGSACGLMSSVGGLCNSLKGSKCVVGSMMMRLMSAKKKEEAAREGVEKALERLEALEECIGEVEKMSERLFRSLVNTRVFLLNILTPSL